MYVLVNVCPLIFFLWYKIKNNIPILCLLFWPTSFLWEQLLKMFLKFTIFCFTLESVSDKSGLQETYFQEFYLQTSLLLWRVIVNYIVLIFFLDCFIGLYFRFYILWWSVSKFNGRYMWMRLTLSHFSDSFSEIFLDVCSSSEYYVINFARCHQLFSRPLLLIVYKFFLSYVAFNCI